MNKTQFSYKFLMEENRRLASLYDSSALMDLIYDKSINDITCRYHMMDLIQIISNYFQKILLLRCSLTENKLFSEIAFDHLKEEFCHHEVLMKERNHRPLAWDPVIEGCCSWFTWKMLTCNDEEKYLLIHLVLESSGKIFFQKAYRIMQKYAPTEYFKIHSEEDEKHELMGRELLQGLSSREYEKLIQLQNQGWEMITAICNRIAEVVRNEINFTRRKTGT